jgi:hypothetical protein
VEVAPGGKLRPKRKGCAPLTGKSTLNRLEHAPLAPSRYHKIGHDAAAIEVVSSTLARLAQLPDGHLRQLPNQVGKGLCCLSLLKLVITTVCPIQARDHTGMPGGACATERENASASPALSLRRHLSRVL